MGLDRSRLKDVYKRQAADREFASGENLLTMLSARNIHTAIFDKEKQIFGEIQEATRTTEEDFCADVEPKISYYSDGDQQRMLMYYAKNEYEATDNAEGVVGDAIYPYSLMAYQFYDFENETWRHTYTEKEKQAIIESGMVTEESFAQYEEKMCIRDRPNEDRGEERVFYVGLEAKGGQIAEDQKVVAVHIVETPEEAVLAEEKSSGEESVSFDSGTKEVRGIKSSGSFNVTSRNSMDLTMADKVTLNLSSGGGRKWKEEVDCEDRWFSSEEGYLEVCIQEGFKILQIYRLPDKTKNMNNVTVEIPLEDKARGTNRHISICFGNLGKNDYTTVKVNLSLIHILIE